MGLVVGGILDGGDQFALCGLGIDELRLSDGEGSTLGLDQFDVLEGLIFVLGGGIISASRGLGYLTFEVIDGFHGGTVGSDLGEIVGSSGDFCSGSGVVAFDGDFIGLVLGEHSLDGGGLGRKRLDDGFLEWLSAVSEAGESLNGSDVLSLGCGNAIISAALEVAWPDWVQWDGSVDHHFPYLGGLGGGAGKQHGKNWGLHVRNR